MTLTALVLAGIAFVLAIFALARSTGARFAASEAATDARRYASNATEELAMQLATQQRLLAMVARGETVTQEMIEEGLCFRDIDGTEAQALAAQGDLQIIDVRTPQEMAAGVVPGAKRIPMDQVENRMKEISKSGPTLIYCAAGSRSAAVCDALAQRGWAQLYNLEGGIGAWNGPLDRPES